MRENMNAHADGTIPGTDEAWEEGVLGSDESFVGHLSADELAADAALIQESMGLQPISIRLEKTLIDDFKKIATIHGLGYQTLMRQALKRFADCEKKRILNELAEQVTARARSAKAEVAAAKKPAKHRKVA